MTTFVLLVKIMFGVMAFMCVCSCALLIELYRHNKGEKE